MSERAQILWGFTRPLIKHLMKISAVYLMRNLKTYHESPYLYLLICMPNLFEEVVHKYYLLVTNSSHVLTNLFQESVWAKLHTISDLKLFLLFEIYNVLSSWKRKWNRNFLLFQNSIFFFSVCQLTKAVEEPT